jgi:hypothetical protein
LGISKYRQVVSDPAHTKADSCFYQPANEWIEHYWKYRTIIEKNIKFEASSLNFQYLATFLLLDGCSGSKKERNELRLVRMTCDRMTCDRHLMIHEVFAKHLTVQSDVFSLRKKVQNAKDSWPNALKSVKCKHINSLKLRNL